MSIQTKEAPAALVALSKAKGQRAIGVVQSTPTIIDGANSVPATPTSDPAVPATQVQTPEPAHGRDYEKAWKELKAHHDKVTYELRQDKTQLETQLASATKVELKLPKTREEVKAWKAQYPEAFDIMTTIALEATEARSSEINKRMDEVNKQASKLAQTEAFNELLKIHPDAKEIKDSPEFAVWFNEQPGEIKNLLARSTDVRAVAKQLSLYKLEVKGINPKEDKKAAAKVIQDASLGVNVNSRTEITAAKKMWSKSEIDAICANYNTWNKFKDEIDLARRENRVDMTK